MQPSKLLLMRLFHRVRTELSLPLGIGEYQLLLDALQQGLGMEDGKSLVKLCETIWIKSRDDREILDDMLMNLIDEEIAVIDEIARQEAEIEQRKKEEAERKKRLGEELKNQKQEKQENQKEETEEERKKREEEERRRQEEERKRREEELRKQQEEEVKTQKTEYEEEVGVVLEIPINEKQQKMELEQNDTFILTNSYQPLSVREMKQIWRMLRHSAKGGLSDEIDIPATVKMIAEEGIVINPIFQADRVNTIRLMLLVDQSSSMVAFHTLARDLVDAAIHGGGHTDAVVYYFNKYPTEHLYTTSNHLKHLPLATVFQKTSKVNTVVMIISDAGAATGEYDSERIAYTQAFLKELKRYVARIAWLNPMPRRRWSGTSAYMIAEKVDMFELMGEIKQFKEGEKLEAVDHRKGMEQAVSLLQGKRI